jgi:hypothetical protein
VFAPSFPLTLTNNQSGAYASPRQLDFSLQYIDGLTKAKYITPEKIFFGA